MIVLITPTGGRPHQFKLCMEWMKRQTYTGRVLWIVIDDCLPKTTAILKDNFRNNWNILKRYPRPAWSEKDNTQGRNLKAAVSIIKALPKGWIEGIFIIEDDDYYKPTYLEEMLKQLKGYDVVGQSNSIYYNIENRVYKIHRNGNSAMRHASLFETCFSINALSLFEDCLHHKWIDVEFWKMARERGKSVNLFINLQLAIGIKGMPGRSGIGTGHKLGNGFTGIKDADLSKLKEFMGEDYKYYIQ